MNGPLNREQLLALVPHAGDMCLLDAVVAHSEHEIECTTRRQVDPGHPLRRDGRLSALHLVEHAAQAMAAHGALRAGGVQRGLLAALRNIRLYAERIDTIDSELSIHATRRLAEATGSLYDFSVRSDGVLLCEGRIAIAFI